MISLRNLLLGVAIVGTKIGFEAVVAKPVVSSRSSQATLDSEPDPSYAVSVELGGTTYVNKVSFVLHLLRLLLG